MNTGTLDLFAAATLLILAVALPLLGMWDFRRLQRWVAEGRADARLRTYNWILIFQWGLTLGLAAWWLSQGRDLAILGLVPVAAGWQWLAVGLGLAGVVASVWQMVAVLRDPQKLDEVRGSMGEVADMVPRTRPEERRFALVAVTAGVCEEILYRGFLLAALAPVVGTWPAVALTSLIFGLGHTYQGLSGLVKTTLAGLALALLTVFSGSLFVPMLLHAAIDLTSGRMATASGRRPERVPDTASA